MGIFDKAKKLYQDQEARHQKYVAKNEDRKAEHEAKKHPVNCPKCKSDDVEYSFENIKHKRGAPARTVGTAGKVAFAPATLGLSLLLPTSKKTDTYRVGSCKNCGNYWIADKIGKIK